MVPIWLGDWILKIHMHINGIKKHVLWFFVLLSYLQDLQFGKQLQRIISSSILIKYIWSFLWFSNPKKFWGLKCDSLKFPYFHILCENAHLIIVNSKPRWDIYAIYNSLRNKMNLLDDTFLIKLQNLFIMRHRVTLKYFFHVTVVKSLHFSLETSCKSFNWWNLQLLLVNSKIMLVTEGMSYPKMVVSMKLPYNDFYPCHYMVCHLKIISRNELTGDLRIVLCVQKCFQKALKWQLAWIEMKYKIFA